MGLQTSGTISLNEIHVEAGGISGTTATINDSDIRGLLSPTPASGSQMDFADWYGASAEVTFNGVVASSKFENFSNQFFPNPTYASDGSDSTGVTRFSGVYPNAIPFLNYYIDPGVTSSGWSGAAPAAAFRGKTILAVRSLSITARTYGQFTANVFGNSDIPRYSLVIANGSLTEYATTDTILNGGLGLTSPRYQTNTFDFYPTKSSNVVDQITLAQAKEVITGGLIARFNGQDDGSLRSPDLIEFYWTADFDYQP